MASKKFTSNLLVSMPYRYGAIPNHDGTLALYEKISSSKDRRGPIYQLRIMNIATGGSYPLRNNFMEVGATWLGDGTNRIAYYDSTYDYMTIQNVDCQTEYNSCRIGGSVKSFRLKPLEDGSIAIVMLGFTDAEGRFCYPRDVKPEHDGMVFDSYRVQEISRYTDKKYSIFYSTLSRSGPDGWEIKQPLHNILAGTKLEPFNNLDLDISQGGITFAAKDLDEKDTSLIYCSSNIYYIQVDSFTTATVHKPEKLGGQDKEPHGYNWNHSPKFSPDGSQIAFYRSPNRICINRLGSPNVTDVFGTATDKGCSLIPMGFEFARDGRSLYMTAEDLGRVGLYKLDLQPGAYPKTLLRDGSVAAFFPFVENNEEKLLVSSSSFVDNSIYRIVNTDGDPTPTLISSVTEHGAKIGLSSKQISEIYFEGGGDYLVHAWMMKPSHFDESRQYPLAILVHGGPRSAWNDAWNWEANPLLWAEKGYIVVAPNITGSTGYGLEFQEAIRDNWGGRPYDDLVKCMDYLETVPNIDINNAVIWGGSYGGYLVNWIQGHPLGRRFKAMISRSGVFDLPTYLLQRDILFNTFDFDGSPLLWENAEGLERYNPARPDLLRKWKTPMLVVHGTHDYRCPLSEALCAFHTLQALGTPSRLLLFRGEGHGSVGGPANKLEYQRQVFAWVNKYTGNADEADVVDDSNTFEDPDIED
ncbi:prolyl oligopeptidase [Annulohypoxylon maeteangense]|uniref:prolyl oligopeptidase n=1 Tax=Annulohypoxylon maeteangense TaxID=1927788 RepID=UPI0020071F10|nr:prolyl oligopeptidase [Annulohypoxylon maeteangense]KAI0890296.1 prolyl oligopeptidase [Annulohypoxylon maeteangense]